MEKPLYEVQAQFEKNPIENPFQPDGIPPASFSRRFPVDVAMIITLPGQAGFAGFVTYRGIEPFTFC